MCESPAGRAGAVEEAGRNDDRSTMSPGSWRGRQAWEGGLATGGVWGCGGVGEGMCHGINVQGDSPKGTDLGFSYIFTSQEG